MIPARWDVFCRVVDNYGDVGIAWRLARQLSARGRSVRLVVDGLDRLARIEPRLDATVAYQRVGGVDVTSWSSFTVDGPSAAVIVEVLGCGLPPGHADALRPVAAGGPVWIDFEHLSAEPWVDDFHGLPSPQPRGPLVKHFFYPGFGPRTGGLWIEPGLDRRRREFIEDAGAVDAWGRDLGLPPRRPAEVRVSLFAYPTAPVAALFDAMRADATRCWTVLVPDGVLPSDGVRSDDSLAVRVVPLTDQDAYDRLLWGCDVNFVRGEDSFVRAQAAGKPLVWQAYRQPDAIHLTKLAAFADRYEAGLASSSGEVQRALWTAWNAGDRDASGLAAAFVRWAAVLPALRTHALRWAERLGADELLVDRLVAFAAAREQPHLLD